MLRLALARGLFWLGQLCGALSGWLYPTGYMRPGLRARLHARVPAKLAIRRWNP